MAVQVLWGQEPTALHYCAPSTWQGKGGVGWMVFERKCCPTQSRLNQSLMPPYFTVYCTREMLTTTVYAVQDGFIKAQGFSFKQWDGSFPGHQCSEGLLRVIASHQTVSLGRSQIYFLGMKSFRKIRGLSTEIPLKSNGFGCRLPVSSSFCGLYTRQSSRWSKKTDTAGTLQLDSTPSIS